ncbi:hypothetical protein MnTg02_00574 [bacterium MnTg02]|nr:hypothetical protein MnTg02_00574 [bacterium MnTg02]
MPARICHPRVLIELIIRIPAENHIAKAKAFIEGGKKFFPLHIFAAQHAIKVENPDLNVRHIPIDDEGLQLFCCRDLSSFHSWHLMNPMTDQGE